jgi:hypothetical protein
MFIDVSKELATSISGETQVLKVAGYFEKSLPFYHTTLRPFHITLIFNVLDTSYLHYSSDTINLRMKALITSSMSIISESLILLY